MVIQGVLALVVIIAVFLDIRERRIPNWITMAGLGAGFALHGAQEGFNGLLMALAGAAVGALVLALPFALGWFGAGDLKLLAAVGALMGPGFALWALLFAVAASGLMAMGWLARKGSLGESLKYTFLVWLPLGGKPAALKTALPFGPALAVGVLVATFWH